MAIEDKRLAVNMSITLSTQLMAAALAILAILGAFTTYALKERVVPSFFMILAIVAFLLFIVSIYFGGKGISKSNRDGFEGNWSIEKRKSYFNKQAIFCFLGLFLFVGLLFLSGPSRESTIKMELAEIETRLRFLEKRSEKSSDSINDLLGEIENIRIEISLLQNKIRLLEQEKKIKIQ